MVLYGVPRSLARTEVAVVCSALKAPHQLGHRETETIGQRLDGVEAGFLLCGLDIG